MASWKQVSNGVDSIWAEEYRAASGWSGPLLVEQTQGGASDPAMLYDEALNVFVAVWRQESGGVSSLYSTRYE